MTSGSNVAVIVHPIRAPPQAESRAAQSRSNKGFIDVRRHVADID